MTKRNRIEKIGLKDIEPLLKLSGDFRAGERWCVVTDKRIATAHGNWFISDQGRVFSTKTMKMLKMYNTVGGGAGRKNTYTAIILSRNIGKREVSSSIYVHNLVAEAFCQKPADSIHVHHIDGNTNNNLASNLRWLTRAEKRKLQSDRLKLVMSSNEVVMKDIITRFKRLFRQSPSHAAAAHKALETLFIEHAENMMREKDPELFHAE